MVLRCSNRGSQGKQAGSDKYLADVVNSLSRRRNMSSSTTGVSDDVDAERLVTSPSIHHVNLKTARLDKMIEWYGRVIGMDVVHKFPGGAWITNDAANHRIALLASENFKELPIDER